MESISLKDVWLKYRIEFKENGRIKGEDFWALRGINLDVQEGETLGIIGQNGAGKTTLLKIIAGMLKPDRGSLKVNGTVSALMEIGAGFQKDLTGRENIHLISSFFGLSREQIEERYDRIAKFASLGRFINAPVKVYSQGMYMRLAFAIAIHVDPDILLVDDIFSVGDVYVQRKCINKMYELKEMGKTILFVTHDMETAKRFCRKSILLQDGKLAREGNLKEVVSYYLKTVGDQKGIGELQGRHLGVIFNNGKLILNWDNESITKGWGGFTSLLSSDSWYSSLEADWEIRELTAGSLVAEGRLWDLPVTQVWYIDLGDGCDEVSIKIEMHINADCDFKECINCFMFRDDYKYWFNPARKEVFAVDDLSGEFSWKTVNSEVPAVNFVGLTTEGKESQFLPSVILRDELYMEGKLLEVKNTDHNFKARVLQSKISFLDAESTNPGIGRHLFFHTKVRVVSEPSVLDDFRKDTASTMIPKVVKSGRALSLMVDSNKNIRLYWNGERLTSSKGFKTDFYYQGRFYESSGADWRVHKTSDRSVEIIARWKDLPLKQVWNMELLDEKRLKWKVYVQVTRRMVIRNNECSIMFSPRYSIWFTSDQEGEVVEELNTEDFKNIVMRNDPYGILGLAGIRSENSELPEILVHDTGGKLKFNSLERKVDINTDGGQELYEDDTVVNMYFLNADSRESINFPPGSHLVFDSCMVIGDRALRDKYTEELKSSREKKLFFLKKKIVSAQEVSIENGRSSLIFSRGRGRLFLENREITKNFGIYTSLYSKEFNKNGAWYASLDAIWDVLVSKSKRLVLKGRWPCMPVVQVWEVTPSEFGFTWKIDMEVFETFLVQRQQTCLMLTENYSHWSSGGKESEPFPREFTVLRWDTFCRQKDVDKLEVSAGGDETKKVLPALNFSCTKEADDFEAMVENSNSTYSSRILGFEKRRSGGNEEIHSGVYRYFHGKIEFK